MIIIALKRRERIKHKRNKWCPTQMLITCWLMPSPSLSGDQTLLANSQSFYTRHGVLWYGISLWPVSCLSLALSQLLVHLLTGRAWGTGASLIWVSTTWQQRKHQYVITVIVILSSIHSSVPAKKKINSLTTKIKMPVLVACPSRDCLLFNLKTTNCTCFFSILSYCK